MLLDLLAGEVALLTVENLTTALGNLQFALATRTLTTAGAGQIDTLLCECGEQ